MARQQFGAAFSQHYQNIKVEDLRWTLRADCAQCDFGKRKVTSQSQALNHVRLTGHTVTTELWATERFSPDETR